jgi:hypothetical protein
MLECLQIAPIGLLFGIITARKVHGKASLSVIRPHSNGGRQGRLFSGPFLTHLSIQLKQLLPARALFLRCKSCQQILLV